MCISFCVVSLFACKKEEVKKPFGAENIDYDKVENINKNGPVHDENPSYNAAPYADKVIVSENGPERDGNEENLTPPIADLEDEPDYGGIPIVKKVK